MPVANPDGYDFTFTAGQRLWRKNLRDNNSDGTDHARRRRRPEPQLRLQVGLRQRGLLAGDPASETYRGPGPNSEPETKALDAFVKRVRLRPIFVNYHSAAELLLYGIGWQVSTPSPDDVIGDRDDRRRRATRPSRAMTPTSPPSSTRPTARSTRT